MYYKKTTIIFTIISLFSTFINAQHIEFDNKEQVDSIFNSIKKETNTIDKANGLIDLFKKSTRKDIINHDIIDEAIKVSKEIYYVDGIAKAYSRKGMCLRHEQEFYESVKNHKRALLYFDKTTDTLAKIKCFNSLGTTYRKLNLEKEAFKCYFQGLELAKKIGNNRSKAIALNGIGNIFIDIKKYENALPYFKKALEFEIINKNKKGIEYDYANIGEVFLYTNQLDSALTYINKAIEMAKKRENPKDIGVEYSLLGFLYQKKGNISKSSDFYKKAINNFTENQNHRYLSNAYVNLGINNLSLNNFEKSLLLIKLGVEHAKKVHSKENLLLGNNALIKYFIKTKQYKKAFETQQRVIELKDSILNDVSLKSITASQVAYQTIEKDNLIKKLAYEKQINKEKAEINFKIMVYSIVLAFILLLFISALFYMYRKNTQLKLENMNNQLQNYVLQLSKDSKSFDEKIAKFNLSEREIDVLKLIMTGTPNNDIAEQLFISINTVKTHVKNIYIKLDAKNRIQAIKKVNNN